MDRIESRLNTNSDEFRRNREAMESLVKRLRDEIERVRQGGPASARERHVERGKLLARDRVKKLLDPGSPFLELSPLAAYQYVRRRLAVREHHHRYRQNPRPRGRDCRQRRDRQRRHLFSDDGEKASARAANRDENRLPCVYLVDSGGAFLPMQSEVFPDERHFGRIFYNQARMSAKGIAQVAVVMGQLHGGRRVCSRDVRRKYHR